MIGLWMARVKPNQPCTEVDRHVGKVKMSLLSFHREDFSLERIKP